MKLIVQGATMFKKSFLCLSFVLSSQLFAGELVDSAVYLRSLSAKILKLSERVDYGNSSPAMRRKLKKEVKKLINVGKEMRSMLGSGGGPGGGYPIVSYEGKCHIDDDPDFTLNQNVVDVRSSSIQGLISDCRVLAQAMYPTRSHSSGVVKVYAVGNPPIGVQSGACHIDDDPDMTFDQFNVGTIYGNSIIDIIADCDALAKNIWQGNASSGLKTINSGVSIPSNAVSGTCHIDDDPDMTFNQFVPGTVFGSSIQAISADCQALAEATFGSNSAHGLRDIQY